MDESEQSDFELLVKIDEELGAQFGIGRAHETKRPVAYSFHYSQMP